MNKKHITSVISLRALLYEILEAPDKFILDVDIKACLVSQSSLAKYTNVGLNIEGCSLNAFKRRCLYVEEGFLGLDKLRTQASEALRKPKVERRSSRRANAKSIQSLERKISFQDKALMDMTLVIGRLKDLAFQLATLSVVDRETYYRSEIKEISLLLSMAGAVDEK